MKKGFEYKINHGRNIIVSSIVCITASIVFLIKLGLEKGLFISIVFLLLGIFGFFFGRYIIKSGKEEKEEYKNYQIMKDKENLKK